MKYIKVYERFKTSDIKSKIILKAIDIIKSYGISIKITNTNLSGGADLVNGYMIVSEDLIKNYKGTYAISALFHELGHFYCYDKGIFKEFHHNFFKKNISEAELKSLVRTSLRAELFVEKWAKEEMSKYFPNMKYYTSYNKKDYMKRWIVNYLYSGFEKRIIEIETEKLSKILDKMGI